MNSVGVLAIVQFNHIYCLSWVCSLQFFLRTLSSRTNFHALCGHSNSSVFFVLYWHTNYCCIVVLIAPPSALHRWLSVPTTVGYN